MDGKKTQATLLVYFVDENNELISEKKVLIANKTTDNPLERIIDMRFLLMNKQYDRNQYYSCCEYYASTGNESSAHHNPGAYHNSGEAKV